MSRPVASDNDGIHHPVAYGAVAERGLKKLYGALFLCFFLMLVLPTIYQLQRGAVLAVLVIIGVGLASTHWKLERAPLVVWLMTSASGVFFILWGLMHGAPGALRVSTVYILWPALYMLFIGLATPVFFMSLTRVLVFRICAAALMLLSVVGGALLGQQASVTQWFAF